MTFREWCDYHKGVRRTIVAVVLVCLLGVVGAGIYYLTELTTYSVQFIREVMLLAAIPMGWYFYQRGKD